MQVRHSGLSVPFLRVSGSQKQKFTEAELGVAESSSLPSPPLLESLCRLAGCSGPSVGLSSCWHVGLRHSLPWECHVVDVRGSGGDWIWWAAWEWAAPVSVQQ